jgi:hypothetical protein
MRTTLDIEPDILQAAKEIAAKERSTAGQVISRLARKGLALPEGTTGSATPRIRNGIPMLPKRGEIVTLEHVRRIMEEEAI